MTNCHHPPHSKMGSPPTGAGVSRSSNTIHCAYGGWEEGRLLVVITDSAGELLEMSSCETPLKGEEEVRALQGVSIG